MKNYWTNPSTGAIELNIYFTNLAPEEFSTKEIIKLYEKRWEIEVACKTLKVVLEWERHVSLDPDIAINVLYGKVMYYNFCAIFREQLELLIPKDDRRISDKSGKEKKEHKHPHHICAKALIEQLYAEELVNCLFQSNDIKRLIRGIISDLVSLINKLTEEIRPGRHYARWGKVVTSSYRYKYSVDGRNHPKVALVEGKLRTVRP